MNIKKTAGLILLGTVLCLLSAAVSGAAETGAVLVKATVAFQGKVLPLATAQVTVLNEPIELEAVDFLAKQEAEKTKNVKRSYHLYRYLYLVKEIENSRRAGLRQERSGIITKRTDGSGTVLFRYLEPGDYFIGAYRKLGVNTIVWFVPFSVTAGRVTEVKLDNGNVFEFYVPALYP